MLPAELRARPGRLTLIRATASGRVCWHVCPAPQAPDALPLGDGKELVFVAAQAGNYELIAWTAGSDGPTEATHCTVKVESEEPPIPPDPLLEKLRAAWSQESDPQRTTRRDLLAAVYRTAADTTIKSSTLHNLGELFTALRQAANAVLPDDALPNIRAAIGEELRKTLPLDPETKMDDAMREKCSTTFRRIADALKTL